MRLKLNSSNNKTLKNFSILTISNAITQFLIIFTSIKIARSLNTLMFGTYNLLQVHVSIFGVLASLGLRNIIIRNIARDKTIVKRVFFIATIIRLAGFLFSIGLFFIYFFFHKQYDIILFVLVIQCILSTVLLDIFESVAFGLEKMEFSGIINLIFTLFWLVTIMLLPKKYFSVQLLFGFYVFFTSLKTIVYFASIYKSDFIKGFSSEKVDRHQITEFSKECFPYYSLSIFTLLITQVPLLFLEYRSGVEQIGFFNIASKILIPINLVLLSALAAIFPNLSRLFITDYKLFIKNVKLIFTLIALFGIAGAFGVTLFRKEVIILLYGEKYITSSLVLGYQCWYIAIYSGVCFIGTILGAINKQKQLNYLIMGCTFIQVPIMWYGAKFGAQYLSAAFLIATFIVLLINIFVLNEYLKDELSFVFYIKILVLYVSGYFLSLLIPVNLSFTYKLIIFTLISTAAGYLIFNKFKHNLKKIFN